MLFTDRAKVGEVRESKDGFKIALARVARTGVQQYLASELGFMGDHIVNVYRPESEVFSVDALQSLSHAPVTIGHPDVAVDATNWKDWAVGEVSTEVMRDDGWLAVPLILKDKRAVDHEFSELSLGYDAKIVLEDGVAPCGTPYQAKQTNIRINHLAMVSRARAGSEARIGDGANKWGISPVNDAKGSPTMNLKTIVLGKEAVQVLADDVSKIEAFQAGIADQATIVADQAAIIADHETEIGNLTAQLADANERIASFGDFDAKVEAKIQLIYLARQVFGDLVTDGLSEAEIKRAAVAHKYGDSAVEGKSDNIIDGMFEAATLARDNDTVRQALVDKAPVLDYSARMAQSVANHLKGKK